MEKRSLLLHSPLNVMVSIKQRLDFQRNSLGYAMNSCLGEKKMSFSLLEKRIKDLSPLSILKRGYSITRRLPEKIVLRDASDVKRGEQVQVLLAKGGLECRVEKLESD
jgi:exodeoxyribonuclease VII large subunit